MPFERDPNELGVLWEKSGGKGPYFTGSIEIDGTKHPIVVFKNGNKRSDKAPDWRILKSQPRPERKTDPDPDDVDHIPDVPF